MQNPYSWIPERNIHDIGPFNLRPDNLIGSYIYWYPNEGPYTLYKEYALFIDVDPTYKTGTAQYVLRIAWNANTQRWIKTIEEWSSNGQNRILNQVDNFSGFSKEGKGYILLDLDLRFANFPSKYTVTLSTTEQFVKNGILCTLRDRSSPVAIPPPQYVITVSPNNIILEPGTKKDVSLIIRSLTSLNSRILLYPTPNKDISINIVPNQTYVAASSPETSITVKANVLKTANPDLQYVLPINANITFPPITSQEITFEGTNISANSANYSSSPSIPEQSNLTIIVHALSATERLSKFYSQWLTPISGIWTFLAGVAAVIGPLFFRWYKKRKEYYI